MSLQDAALNFAKTGRVPRTGNMRPMQAKSFDTLVQAALGYAKTSDDVWAAEVAELKECLSGFLKRYGQHSSLCVVGFVSDRTNLEYADPCSCDDLFKQARKLLED